MQGKKYLSSLKQSEKNSKEEVSCETENKFQEELT